MSIEAVDLRVESEIRDPQYIRKKSKKRIGNQKSEKKKEKN